MDWAGSDIGPSPCPDEGRKPTSNEHQELTDGWAVYESKTHKGKVYYFNKKTNTKCWHLPLDVQGDDDRLSSHRESRPRLRPRPRIPRPINSSSLPESTEFLALTKGDNKPVASSVSTNDCDEPISPIMLSSSYQESLIIPRPNSSYASTDEFDTEVNWKLTEITLPPQEGKYCEKILEHYYMLEQKQKNMQPVRRPELNEILTLSRPTDTEVTTSKKKWNKRKMSPKHSEPVKSYKHIKLRREGGPSSIQSTPTSPRSKTQSWSRPISDDLQPHSASESLPVTYTSSTLSAIKGGPCAGQPSVSFTPVRPESYSPSPLAKSRPSVPTSQRKNVVLPRSAETLPSTSRKLHDDCRKQQRKSYSSNDGCNSTPTNSAERRMQKLVKDLQENQKQATNVGNRLVSPVGSPHPATLAKRDVQQQLRPPVSTPKARPPVPHTVVRPTVSIPPNTKFLDALKSPEFDEDGSLVCNAEEQVLLSSQRIAAFNAKENPFSSSLFPSSAGHKTCPSGPQRSDKENSVCKTVPVSAHSQGSKSTPQSRNAVTCSPQRNFPLAQSTPRTFYTASATSMSQHDVDVHATYSSSVPSGGPNTADQVIDNFDNTMEWEANEIEQREMITDVRNIRKMLCSEELNPILSSNVPLITAQLCQANYFIVVDSNILMGHLKFLEHLRDHRYTTLEPLVLIIPWAVLQELDKLKDGRRGQPKRSLSVNQARLAVRWLNDQLSNSHPRVKGQTSFDLSPIQFTCIMADDCILKCCRQLEPFAQHVVLLTNDNNLRNKAATLLIQAKSRDEIQAALSGMPPAAACARPPPTRSAGRARPPNALDAPVCGDAALADRILCDYKAFMLQVLTNVFTALMIDAYGPRAWVNIVKIKPPWLVLGDVIQNILKHWMAVMSLAFLTDSKKLEFQFQALDKFFNSPGAKSYNNTLKDVRGLVTTSMDICRRLPHKEFGHMIPGWISKLQEYIAECEGSSTHIAEVPAQLHDSNGCAENSSVCSESDGTLAQNDFKLIHNTLDTFWDKLRCISVAGCSYFNIGDNMDNRSVMPPSKDVISAAIVNTNPMYGKLVASVNGILGTPMEQVSPSNKWIVEFHNTLSSISQEYNQRDFPVSLERLTEFCIMQRVLLRTGIGEIEEFGAKIGEIFNRFIQMEINM